MGKGTALAASLPASDVYLNSNDWWVLAGILPSFLLASCAVMLAGTLHCDACRNLRLVACTPPHALHAPPSPRCASPPT